MSADVSNSDISAYFTGPVPGSMFSSYSQGEPVPTVLRTYVNGAKAGFNASNDASDEAALDVEMAAGAAPDATIMLYDIPSLTDANIEDAYAQVVDDNKVDVVNSSFGGCELDYTASYNGGKASKTPSTYDSLIAQGVAQGITWTVSSGDWADSSQCLNTTYTAVVKGVSFPAADPHVVAVGGTNLVTAYTAGSRNSAYVSEEADQDKQKPERVDYIFGPFTFYWGSGGGNSVLFTRPSWQAGFASGSGRGVPDMAMHMGGCPQGSVTPCNANDSYDAVVVGGATVGLIGTSASSPEFAGLIALKVQLNGGTRLGELTPWMYANAASASLFRTNIPGNNGYAGGGIPYNYVTGLGTPIGISFVAPPVEGCRRHPWNDV